MQVDTWELTPCRREPIAGEIRYLRRMIPNPIEPLAALPWPIFYPAIWNGEKWLPVSGD